MLAANLNFSKASEALHISQSALSAAIQGLEEALSARLFDRSTRIVELTATGLLLQKEAEELLAHFDHSIQRVRDFVSGAQGRLQIAASPSVMAGLLPLALNRFNEMYPGVAVEVREEVHASCVYLVRARKVDFALTPGRQDYDDLCQTRLFDDRLVALCAPDHPFAQQDTVKWTDLIKERIIAVSRDSSVRQIVETAFARYAKELRPAVEVERATSAMSFAAAGLGIAIMPLSLVKYADSQYLVRQPIDASDAVRTICAIRLAARTPSSATENFIALCRQVSKTG